MKNGIFLCLVVVLIPLLMDCKKSDNRPEPTISSTLKMCRTRVWVGTATFGNYSSNFITNDNYRDTFGIIYFTDSIIVDGRFSNPQHVDTLYLSHVFSTPTIRIFKRFPEIRNYPDPYAPAPNYYDHITYYVDRDSLTLSLIHI